MSAARWIHQRLRSTTIAAWGAVPSPEAMIQAPVQAWWDATTWWVDRFADVPWVGSAVDGRLLAQTVEGLARTLRGRRIDLAFGDSRVRSTLESLQLERRGTEYGARLQLRDAEWQGLHADAISVVAATAALTAPPDLTLTLSAVEISGRTDLAPLVAWLDGALPQWQLAVSSDQLIEVRRPRGGARLVVAPAIVDGRLTVEVLAVGWHSRPVRLPRRFRVTRLVELPVLAGGLLVSQAQRDGSAVEFRLLVPTVSRRLGMFPTA